MPIKRLCGGNKMPFVFNTKPLIALRFNSNSIIIYSRFSRFSSFSSFSSFSNNSC